MIIFRLFMLLGASYYTFEPIAWTSGLLSFSGLALTVWLAKKIYFALTAKRPILKINYQPAVILILLPFFITFFELFQARFALLPGFIVSTGNTLGSSPFLGLAGLGGLITLTFFAASINALLAGLFFYNFTLKGKLQLINKHNINIILLAAIALLLLGAWQFSAWQLKKNSASYSALGRTAKIALVSTNEKFSFSQFEQIKQELLGQALDLVVLPEDVFYFPNQARLSPDEYSTLMQNLTKELNANVLAVYRTTQNQKQYNSALLFNQQGKITSLHNKYRLTFAGEYWPFGSWRPPLSELMKKVSPEMRNFAVFNPANAFRQGDQNTMSVKLENENILFAAAICQEIHYPFDFEKQKKAGARFVVNTSSNRWLSDGLDHFFSLVNNLRKIESVSLNLPILTSGVKDQASLFLPGGQMLSVGYDSYGKNYSLLIKDINY